MLEHLPQIKDENLIFQQDGSLAHYANVVCDIFDEKLPQHWIGRWLIWGYIIQNIYSETLNI